MPFSINVTWLRLAALIIVLITLIVILFVVTPLVWSVLRVFIVSGLLALALDGPVRWQVKHGIPRWAATLELLLLVVLLGWLIMYFLIPPFIAQVHAFLTDIPSWWNNLSTQAGSTLNRYPQLSRALNPDRFVTEVLRGTETWLATARSIFTSAVGMITAVILVFVTTFYTLVNPWPLLYGIRGLFPSEWWPKIDQLASSIAERLRAWVVGTLGLALVVGTLVYLGLLLANLFFEQDLPFIFLFAILAGLLEVIPVVGPIASSIPPTLVGLAIDPLLGVIVLGIFFLVQQLENYIIAPLIMQRATRMHPVSLLFALVVLSGLFGPFGAIISVPTASILKVLYNEWYYPLMHQGEGPQPPPDGLDTEAPHST